tara:strand:- start:60 stop:578 length:519 start_codon:yes stop_codon:yes gene_type:complete
MTIEIIDNFLPDHDFKLLTDVLLGTEFPWYFNDQVVDDGISKDDRFQFTHCILSAQGLDPCPDKEQYSNWYPLFEQLLNKLKVRGLLRIKINLNTKTFEHEKSKYHIDVSNIEGSKTAIYYLNTNNGWTRFKKGDKVSSVANRMVIFDSNLEHSGVTCTNEQRRLVVNLNYV